MKKVLVGLVSAAALASVTVGMAAATNSMNASSGNSFFNNSASGIFISGNLGYGSVTAENSDYGLTPTSLNHDGLAWNVNLGYQFNPYFAVEVGYIAMPDVTANFAANIANKATLDGFAIDAKGILPINQKVDLFAKAGAIDMSQKQTVSVSGATADTVSGSAWTPELGLGADYNVTKNVAITLQDIYTMGAQYNGTDSQNLFSGTVTIPTTNSILVGASYKFSM